MIPMPFDTHTVPPFDTHPTPRGMGSCPTCGKCPTCGRPAEPYGRRPIHPWKEWPWGDSEAPWYLPKDAPQVEVTWSGRA
jgi:hypothetical protein